MLISIIHHSQKSSILQAKKTIMIHTQKYISENKLFFIGNGQEKCERLIKKNSNLIDDPSNLFV